MANLESNVLVSVGIPFYNAEEYLSLAVMSIINQSFADWELILIDDGSSDRSLDIAKRFEKDNKNIRVISDGQNKKLPHRLNQLVYESNGKYIARMDADDIAHPNRLKIQLEFLEKNPNYDLVATGIISIDSNNNVHGYRNEKFITTNINIKNGSPIAHPTLFAKKSWYERNSYSEDYPRSEDYELWCRASSKGDFKIAILPNLLLYYRELGVISSSKLINSYQDNLQVRLKYKKYSNKNKYIQKSKTQLKCFLNKIIFMMGVESYLVERRNNVFSDSNIVLYHQNIVNKIVKSIE